MSFPFNWPAPDEAASDCRNFRYFLADIIHKHLPCGYVQVIPEVGGGIAEAALSTDNQEILAHIRKKGKPVVAGDVPRLFLPLSLDGKLYSIAILEGGESALYKKYTTKALLDAEQLITGDYLALRARGGDPLTGLFNGTLWQETVSARLSAETPFCLVLSEIYPRIRDAAHAYAYLKRAAGALDSMAGKDVAVYHLGAGVFGMVWEGMSGSEARTLADVILYRLQRDGMSRAHMGQVWCEGEEAGFEEVMDRCWQAVVKARQRGPFAKAAHMSEADLFHHPFRPLTPRELNLFKDSWQQHVHFCLAVLQPDGDNSGFAEAIRQHTENGCRVVERETGEIYLVFTGSDIPQAREFLQKLQDATGENSFSAGLAEFPCGKFKRSAVVLNARKALQHTFFFGPGSFTSFDAVSLNISGDVYYNEGDMNGAAREYLLGLDLDGTNVNLLNSLGVAYVRLNRYKTAISFFEKALGLDNVNYMAIFNLGSAWLTLGRDELAVDYFEKALEVDKAIFDLFLQLAELYCRNGNYERVVELLAIGGDAPEQREEWENAAALRCLGEAWRNLGENNRAMECLQRASSYNPQDSRALSLLGEVYDVEKQGADIALSLCREAVDLDDDKWDNWLRLGKVQFRNDQKQASLASLQQSMKLNRNNIDAARMLKKIYDDGGKKRLAAGMAEKIRKIKKSM